MSTRLDDDAPRVLEQLDAELDKLGWDQPHRLFFVYALDEGGFKFSEFPLFRISPHPLTPLQNMARMFRERRDLLLASLPGNLYGWLLASETWMLTGAKDSAEAEEMKRIQRERRIHQDPRRREARLMILAPLTGGIASRTHLRGKGLMPAPDEEMVGDIPEALVDLAAATVGQ